MSDVASTSLPPDANTVNKGELARILDVSLPTLARMIAELEDFPVVARGDKGVEWRFDPAAVLAYLDERREREREASASREGWLQQFSLPGLEETDEEAKGLTPSQRLQLAKALRAEQENAVAAGLLIPKAEMRRVLQTAFARLGRFLDTLPGQIGTPLNLPDEVTRAMRNQIEDARRALVRDLRELVKDADIDAAA